MATYEHPTTLGDGGEGGHLAILASSPAGLVAFADRGARDEARAVVRYDESAPEGEPCIAVVVSRPDGKELVRVDLDADAVYALAAMLDSYMHPAGWRRLDRGSDM